MAAEDDIKKDDAVAIELPAPAGWVKKIIPKKGGTPHRNDIVFISPTGDEIKTKRQLEQYLKSHPGGPAASEFYWATGDTPRRSARLGEKSKAVETSALQSPMKKQKRLSTKRGANDKNNDNAEGDKEKSNATAEGDNERSNATAEGDKEKSNATAEGDNGKSNATVEGDNEKSNATAEGEAVIEKDAAGEETKESNNVPITDAKDVGEDKAVADQALPENPDAENAEKAATKPPNDANTDRANSKVKESNDEATDSAANAKIEESEKAPLVLAGTQTSIYKEPISEAPTMQNDKSNDESHIEKEKEKEAPAEPIDTVDPTAAALDQDSSKDEQAADIPNNKDPALENPATGS